MKMRNEVMFAGFGGQGVVKAALLLSLAAGLHEDKEVAQTQSYGPEARGGGCRSEVVISDKELAYMTNMNIDTLVLNGRHCRYDPDSRSSGTAAESLCR
jgi:2-oxoglutarate ferredoxin oxidoreductase subunit gamma